MKHDLNTLGGIWGGYHFCKAVSQGAEGRCLSCILGGICIILLQVIWLNPYLAWIFTGLTIFCTAFELRRERHGLRYREHDNRPTDFHKFNVMVTGATSGCGFAATVILLKLQCNRIFLPIRGGPARVAEVMRAIYEAAGLKQSESKCKLIGIEMNMEQLDSVKKGAAQVVSILGQEPLDILICNAAVMDSTPAEKYRPTVDGFQKTFQVNVLANFIIMVTLQQQIAKSTWARIVCVNSIGHHFAPRPEGVHWNRIHAKTRAVEDGYEYRGLYGQSKLALFWIAREFQRRAAAARQKTVVISVHPGVVDTQLARQLDDHTLLVNILISGFFACVAKSPVDGAQTLLFGAFEPTSRVSAEHLYVDGKPGHLSDLAQDQALAKDCWKRLEIMCSLWL